MKQSYSWTFGLIAASALIMPSLAHAQDKNAFRDQAKASLAQLQGQGEPKDRCSMGAFVGEGGLVTRTFSASALKPGDRLISINRVDVSGKQAEDIIALLRQTGPAAVIPVSIERGGQPTDVEVSCSNARPATEALLNGLNLAARGKFDECVSAFGQRGDLGTYGAAIKVQCASLSSNSEQYNLAQFTFEAMQMLVEDARWAPPMRTDVIRRLRASEGLITQGLGVARFQELVTVTRSWPGGERMFEESAPDWALFRRNSEVSLRARLIDPDSARIEWPYGFTYGTWKPILSKRVEGYWTCGSINARNRMGGYTGSTSFVVVLDPNGLVQFVDMGEARDFDFVTSQCNGSVKFLPPPQRELAGAAVAQPAQGTSIADELRKLVDLKNSGALSEAEFQAAKQRLLGTSGQQ